MLFVMVALGLLGVIGALLAFTGWAEERVIQPEARSAEAKLR
jgi:hypothetical protein